MTRRRARVLFTNWIDTDNFNAQSLNVREIALRLDPERFSSTLFYSKQPDPRLIDRPSIRLVRVPPRFGTATMFAEALRGHDFWFRANDIPPVRLYLSLPKALRQRAQIVDWLEGPTRPHTDPLTEKQRADYRRIQSYVSRRAAVTRYVAQTHWEDYGLETEAIIPAGVDTNHFVPPLGRSNREPTVLFVGHLVERKNPKLVVDAACRFPQVRFVIVGAARDAYGAGLLSRLEVMRLSNLTVRAPMGRDALRDLMQASDIFLHPSLIEGSPKVVSEAGATGLPGLVFDHYQSFAVSDGVTGFQVKTEHEMLAKLGLLIEDRALRARMGATAVKHARLFDWDVVAHAWQELLLDSATGRFG
jgi:glycosyltransferase involved in cell wall biosynthesis